jgi:hypothetical protein
MGNSISKRMDGGLALKDEEPRQIAFCFMIGHFGVLARLFPKEARLVKRATWRLTPNSRSWADQSPSAK